MHYRLVNFWHYRLIVKFSIIVGILTWILTYLEPKHDVIVTHCSIRTSIGFYGQYFNFGGVFIIHSMTLAMYGMTLIITKHRVRQLIITKQHSIIQLYKIKIMDLLNALYICGGNTFFVMAVDEI